MFVRVAARVGLADDQKAADRCRVARLGSQDEVVPIGCIDRHVLCSLVQLAADHGAHGAESEEAGHRQHGAHDRAIASMGVANFMGNPQVVG